MPTFWTGSRIADAIATYRARRAQKAAQEAEVNAILAAEAAERLRAAAAEREKGMAAVYAREAERKRVAEISARGGVPMPDPNEFAVVPDAEASLQAQLNDEQDWMRFKQVNGPRRNLRGSELPKVNREATDADRLINPNAPAVYYWPETK